MHQAARQWVADCLPVGYRSVAEFGSRDINGGIRDLLDSAADYVGVDVNDGPGVDVVADAALWQPDTPVDLIICAEVFEHTPTWRAIIENAYVCLAAGGVFIATAAGPGRAPHSAHSEGRMRPDEYYRNIEPQALEAAMVHAGFVDVTVDQAGTDVRCRGVRHGS